MPTPYISHTCFCLGDKPTKHDPDSGNELLAGQEIHADTLWDNGETIQYAFLGNRAGSMRSGTPRQQNVVRDAMAEWMQYANVKFVESDDAQDSASRVRISFNVAADVNNRGSWAAMGEESTTEVPHTLQTMNIAWTDGGTEEELREARAVVLHQIGHLLGMRHEFGRTVTLKRDFIYRTMALPSRKWSANDVDRVLFDILETRNLTNFPSVDENSIMKYYMNASQNNEQVARPPNPELNESDKAFVYINYPYTGSGKKSMFPSAMSSLGIDTTTMGKLVKSLKNGDLATLRLEYTKNIGQQDVVVV